MDPYEIVVLVGAAPPGTAVACGVPLFVHVPMQPEVARVPDSPTLWDRIWLLRVPLLGIAHTHPPGTLTPSSQDIQTASAVERALGRKLRWWIVDPDDLRTVEWSPAGSGYSISPVIHPPTWALLAATHAHFACR